MKYDQWQLRDFTNVNLRMDLPVGVRAEEVFDGTKWILSMGFHYLSPPPGVLDDATVFVHVYVEKITPKQFAEKKIFYLDSGLYKRGDSDDHKFWFWYYDHHHETSLWREVGNYSYYRRDIKLNDGEILCANAEVLNAGSQESKDADYAATKRILDSIQPLKE